MKARKKNRIVINVAEKEAAFTILIGIFLVILIGIALILFLPYALTPEHEVTQITTGSSGYYPCSFDEQCESWEECKDNFCTPIKDRCIEDKDCEEWKKCNVKTLTCFNKVGRCASDAECMYAEYCDLNTHYCVFDPSLVESI